MNEPAQSDVEEIDTGVKVVPQGNLENTVFLAILLWR